MQTENEYIKIAIKVDNESKLHKIHKTQRLQDIIDNVCQEHKKTQNISWGFKFHHTVELMDHELVNKYVTDSSQLVDGCILTLVPSISHMLWWIFDKLDLNETGSKFSSLNTMCNDVACIEEIKNTNRYNAIPRLAMIVRSDDVGYCLKSLNKIISHGVIPALTDEFIKFLVNTIKSGENVLNASLSLELLSKLLNVDTNILFVFKDQLRIDHLTPYFWRDDNLVLQLNTLTLLNNIVENSSESDREKLIVEMNLELNRNIIYKYVIANGKKDKRIAHELFVYQTYILSTYYINYNQEIRAKNTYGHFVNINLSNRRNTIIDFEEKDIRSRKNTMSSEGSDELQLSTDQCLDESDNTFLRNKSQSLQSIASILILSNLTVICMEYYEKMYNKNFIMSVLEAQYYPGFYTICDQIVHMLCDILHISKEQNENCELCIPIIFSSEKSHFFEELFCRAVWLLAKTRREMKARVDEDHEKVLAVLKVQIRETLKTWPRKYNDLSSRLKTISYKEIFDMWEIERAKKWEDKLQKSPSVKELKTKMIPDIEELIRQQRMQVLKKGECFPKLPEKRGRQLYWSIYLTQNNQKFQYGNFDPETEHYTSPKSEIAVSDIACVVIGKASPHVKDHRVRRVELFSRCFSLFLKDEGTIDFLAPDDGTAQYWTDGLHLLLGKPAISEKYRSEKEVLLNMDINLHLLDLQNIPLPSKPPVIPPLPPDCLKPAVPPKSPSLGQVRVRKTIVLSQHV